MIVRHSSSKIHTDKWQFVIRCQKTRTFFVLIYQVTSDILQFNWWQSNNMDCQNKRRPHCRDSHIGTHTDIRTDRQLWREKEWLYKLEVYDDIHFVLHLFIPAPGVGVGVGEGRGVCLRPHKITCLTASEDISGCWWPKSCIKHILGTNCMELVLQEHNMLRSQPPT